MIFYSFYSIWVLGLLLLQLLRIIKFSCIPSAILVSIGTIIMELVRYHKGTLTYASMISDFLIHIPPFILVSLKFSVKDILMNIIVLVIYSLYLYINKITIPHILNDAVTSNIHLFKND